ncbi:MAG: hypothetical protein JXR70_04020 [Spirochaetales bacterium]|nr:hypothetical protein [Spirochaetales bacterium]
MKKIVFMIVMLFLFCQGIFAGEEPQIAYRMLDAYVQNKNLEAKDKTAWWVVTGVGSALALGGITTYVVKDQFTQDPEKIKIANIVSYSLMGTGVSLSVVGLIGLFSEPPDYSKKYQDVYSENDPKVREALAAANLRDLAIQGKNKRVSSAFSYFLVPIISGVITITFNLVDHREWSTGLTGTLSGTSYNIIFGIIELMTPSKEEMLYDKYKAAHSAYYGS